MMVSSAEDVPNVTHTFEYPLNSINFGFYLHPQRYGMTLSELSETRGSQWKRILIKLHTKCWFCWIGQDTHKQGEVDRRGFWSNSLKNVGSASLGKMFSKGYNWGLLCSKFGKPFCLNVIDNYLIVEESKHHFQKLHLFFDYDNQTKLIIVRDNLLHDGTDDKKGRNNVIADIIFKILFENKDLGEKWDDLELALRYGNLKYCRWHSCLKPWEARPLTYNKISSTISNRIKD